MRYPRLIYLLYRAWEGGDRVMYVRWLPMPGDMKVLMRSPRIEQGILFALWERCSWVYRAKKCLTLRFPPNPRQWYTLPLPLPCHLPGGPPSREFIDKCIRALATVIALDSKWPLRSIVAYFRSGATYKF